MVTSPAIRSVMKMKGSFSWSGTGQTKWAPVDAARMASSAYSVVPAPQLASACLELREREESKCAYVCVCARVCVCVCVSVL